MQFNYLNVAKEYYVYIYKYNTCVLDSLYMYNTRLFMIIKLSSIQN